MGWGYPACCAVGNPGGERQKHHPRGPHGFQKGSRDRRCGGKRGGEEGGPTRLGLPDKIQGMEWDILIIKMTFVYLNARLTGRPVYFFLF